MPAPAMSSASIERPAWGHARPMHGGSIFSPRLQKTSPQRSCAAPSHVSEGLAPLSQYLRAPGPRGRSLCQRGRGQLPRPSLQRSRCSARPIMDGQSRGMNLYPAHHKRRGGLGVAGQDVGTGPTALSATEPGAATWTRLLIGPHQWVSDQFGTSRTTRARESTPLSIS